MKRALNRWPLWIWVVCALLAVFIFWGAATLEYVDHLFTASSVHVQGRAIHKYMTQSQGRHGTTYLPHLTYSYQAGDLKFRTQTVILSQTWHEVTTGGEVPVKYLIRNPARSRIDLPAENRLASLHADASFGLGLLVLIGAGAGLVFTLRRNRLVAALIQRGIRCEGRVISHETEPSGKVMLPYLIFSFADNRGRTIEGRTWDLKSNHDVQWPNGSVLPVYYDPANPEVFTVDLGAAD